MKTEKFARGKTFVAITEASERISGKPHRANLSCMVGDFTSALFEYNYPYGFKKGKRIEADIQTLL